MAAVVSLDKGPVSLEMPANGADGDLIARIVDRLPIGITIRDKAQRTAVYENRAATQHGCDGTGEPDGGGQDRAYDIDTYEMTVDGRAYEVVASVDTTRHAKIQDELTRRAFYDDLTGLPKRDLFERTLNTMIAERCAPFALSFIDIDNFKYVNDYYGHAVGDHLLTRIVQRISNCMRPTDLLARVGGDEFVLLTTPIETLEEPSQAIEHLSRRFREPFFIDGYEIFSSASIGVSLYPIHGNDYATLRANADSAMYRVKNTTKGGVSLFDARLGDAATRRMEAEQRLRLSIRDRRLTCAFQPKVDFRTNEIVGVEILLRWLDENGDFQPPGDLVNVAIELGLMDDIALLLLDHVTDQIDLINDAFGPNTSISINIAAKQATDVGFMAKFVKALQATGYAERFIVELTEEAFLSKGEFQDRVLPMLREIGTGVSIDDFGVGYSSLSALAEITADELKVDRSFITDIHKRPRNQSILKVIELLGASLGIRVVVEGVETFEELAYLTTATRISYAQGYYFAKPLFLQSAPRPSSYAEGHENRQPARSGAKARGSRGWV